MGPATKDGPATFALGVNIAEVITMVLTVAEHQNLLSACEWLEDAMDKDSNIWIAIRNHEGCGEWIENFRAVIAKVK